MFSFFAARAIKRLGLTVIITISLCVGILAGSLSTAATVRVSGQGAVDDQTTLLARLYQQANPSVVNIRVAIKPGADTSGLLPDQPNQPNGQPNSPATPNANQPQPSEEGDASGIVYDTNGDIVTNSHVVSDTTSIIVTFADDYSVKAKFVGIDLDSDLAVIKVDPGKEKLAPLTFADSDKLQVGERAVAIGNPYRLNGTMTQGIVSAVGRSLEGEQNAGQDQRYLIPDVIQTDAPINPGNSGGPLLNSDGEVIGVNTWYLRQSLGLGFAIPSNIVKKVIPALIKDGKISHAYLGIAGGTLYYELNELIGLDVNFHGVLVNEASPDGPAGKARLKSSTVQKQLNGETVNIGGDIITAIDGHPVNRFEDLLAYLFVHAEPGQMIKLTIYRDGKTMDVPVTLTARPTN